jgi:ribulose bisphosphate carboxylase small subunit
MMHIERIRPTVLQITIHSYELAALIAAARWVCEGATGDLSPEAVTQLQRILADYDAEFRRVIKIDNNT